LQKAFLEDPENYFERYDILDTQVAQILKTGLT
jgi:hypothetical protein